MRVAPIFMILMAIAGCTGGGAALGGLTESLRSETSGEVLYAGEAPGRGPVLIYCEDEMADVRDSLEASAMAGWTKRENYASIYFTGQEGGKDFTIRLAPGKFEAVKGPDGSLQVDKVEPEGTTITIDVN